ncbi:lipopolysaccharide assembly protein LapB [Wenzhouxiangella sp. AB-CW3]|uniref:lipopolysaccharide assembly protein LapB n=1 Tax=Wenzhouxiangella sp. AB-CW3 TaxID=2771012 RepID=UPI00168AC23A|nr:lipopolysaccharide assembly protein LapB [Wenzhouxiangella sp. AB-CW3]QOC21649.1 lipopolysaccharide assembly protein LapB [Wenzhouxiangella sp. AB-CW3]
MLDYGLLFVLLVLAAASGWLVARRRETARRRRRTGALSTNYFKGLNYLLNEQPDKAIEVFLKLAEINRDTVETHLALGNLFRRRGEMDKAIRFHKHIITRPDLSDEQRSRALLELGEDYMQAGLLDRAERLFSELLEHSIEHDRPARQLLDIYQQEKDWEKAIVQARRLRRHDGEGFDRVIGHLYCEIAREALERGDSDAVAPALRQARRHDPRSARARLLQAELSSRRDDWHGAAEYYREACELDPDCLVFSLDVLMEAHRHSDQSEAVANWLADMVEKRPMSTAILALARIKADSDPQQAVEFLLQHQSQRPTVKGLEYLIELVYRQGVSLDELGPDMMRDLVQRLLEDQPLYRCQHCGFSGRTWHWQCPGCRQWDSTRAIAGVLGE